MLSDDFIARIQAFTAKLAEVDSRTVEEKIQEYNKKFKNQAECEKDLKVWEQIATAYQLILKDYPTFAFDEREEVYAVLLRLTMGMTDFSSIKKINEDQIKKIEAVFSCTVLNVIKELA